MSGKSKSEKYPQNRTDTVIGAGTRAEGNITFTGVLRVQGDILGDVSCEADPQGTIVVDESGNITGTLTAPHIVVGGRVAGPLHSSATIEVRQGGRIAGDIVYSLLDIHAGGAVDGSLTPTAAQFEGSDPEQGSRMQDMQIPAHRESTTPLADTASAGGKSGARLGGRRMLGGAVALVIVAIAVMLARQEPGPAATVPVDAASPKSAALAIEAAAMQAAPVAAGGRPEEARVPAAEAAPPAPTSGAATPDATKMPLPVAPAKLPETVVAVHGVNPGKPAGVFLVIAKEPAVLFRKKPQDAGEGTRIEIAQGTTESISFAKPEMFRVASGRDVTIFYQGRKVAPRTVEAGAWMNFVPQSTSGAGDK